MNANTLVVVHGYAGDQRQIEENLDMYEHHQRPVLILSPEDSPINKIGPHHCRFGGKRAYIGQDSIDRQLAHLRILCEYPFEWYLLNDADSFCVEPKLPDYLFKDDELVYSNEVKDFRVPGQRYVDASQNIDITSAPDYHAGFPLIAMQPPYFMHKRCLIRMVQAGRQEACPVTPFIDWYMVQACTATNVRHSPFQGAHGANCETVTPNGRETLINCVKRGAIFLHSIKNGSVKNSLVKIYNEVKASTLHA